MWGVGIELGLIPGSQRKPTAEVSSQFWHQHDESLELHENDVRGLSEFLYLYKNLKKSTSSLAMSHSPENFMSRLIRSAQINTQVFRYTFVSALQRWKIRR